MPHNCLEKSFSTTWNSFIKLFFLNYEYCTYPYYVQLVGLPTCRLMFWYCKRYWSFVGLKGLRLESRSTINFQYWSRVGFTCQTSLNICLSCFFLLHFCEGSDDNDSLNRSFTCRMKCTLNHGGGFYKVIIVLVVVLYI